MARDARIDLIEHSHGRTDLTGRAITALVTVMFDESGLHRMEIHGGTEALNCGNTVAFMHHGERQTCIDPTAIDDHRASAALPVIAAFLRT